MTPAEARERYDVTVSHADDGERVTAADGTELVVLVNARDGTRRVVHADVVDTSRNAVLLGGLAGFCVLIATLMVPIAAGLLAGVTAGHVAVTIGAVGTGVVASIYAANLVLYRTAVHDWIFRFIEWNDHRALVERHRQGGEPA